MTSLSSSLLCLWRVYVIWRILLMLASSFAHPTIGTAALFWLAVLVASAETNVDDAKTNADVLAAHVGLALFALLCWGVAIFVSWGMS